MSRDDTSARKSNALGIDPTARGKRRGHAARRTAPTSLSARSSTWSRSTPITSTPNHPSELTWAPANAVEELAARDREANPGQDALHRRHGTQPVLQQRQQRPRRSSCSRALTGNVGKISGNVGSYAGNYRVALLQRRCRSTSTRTRSTSRLDPTKPARPKQYWKPESAHYLQPRGPSARRSATMLTGESPTCPWPTKSMWFANANSILGNVKWHYNTVVNVLPRIEMIAVQECSWWWSTSCEWADVVFAVDSWAELNTPGHVLLGDQPLPDRLSAAHRCRAPSTPTRRHRRAGDGRPTSWRSETGDRRFAACGTSSSKQTARCLPAAHSRPLGQHDQGVRLQRSVDEKAAARRSRP